MRFAPIIGATFPLFLAGIITGIHIDNFLLEQTFDRILDLNFVRARTYAKNIFVLLLAHQRRFLGQRCGSNDVVGLVHNSIYAVAARQCWTKADESFQLIFRVPYASQEFSRMRAIALYSRQKRSRASPVLRYARI